MAKKMGKNSDKVESLHKKACIVSKKIFRGLYRRKIRIFAPKLKNNAT